MNSNSKHRKGKWRRKTEGKKTVKISREKRENKHWPRRSNNNNKEKKEEVEEDVEDGKNRRRITKKKKKIV